MKRIRASTVKGALEEISALSREDRVYMSVPPSPGLMQALIRAGVKEVYCPRAIFNHVPEARLKRLEGIGVKIAPLNYANEMGLQSSFFIAREENTRKQLEKYDGLYENITKRLPPNWANMSVPSKREYIKEKFKDNGVDEYTAYAYAVRKIA
jgi:hypothetical protein